MDSLSHTSPQVRVLQSNGTESEGDISSRDQSQGEKLKQYNRASSLGGKATERMIESNLSGDFSQGKNYKLLKVIGKGTYSTVYLTSARRTLGIQKSKSSLNVTQVKTDDTTAGANADVVSQISEVLPEPEEAPIDNEEDMFALKVIQRPNFQKFDQSYMKQKLIFMNDAHVLKEIQGHPNIVELKEILPEGIVETADGQKLHVDYAMVIESLKGGELYYNLKKFGRFPPRMAHYFFCQVLDAIVHMNNRGFCHRDLKPWNIMLIEDLSSARVIDFSYSTPLRQERLEACPDILKGWLSGTIQFMAPEQADTKPFTNDFTKIDVWALAVLLINMLTLEFAFEGVHQDRDRYERFMASPSEFFQQMNVQFESEEELNEMCSMLQAMLHFDKDKRITAFEAQKMPYVSKYCQFTKSDGNKYTLATQDEVRQLMKDRVAVDRTLGSSIIDDDLSTNALIQTNNLPIFQHFCWNLSIIRHSLQRINSLEVLLQYFRNHLNTLFGCALEHEIYTLTKLNNHDNVILLTINQAGDKLQNYVRLKKSLEIVIAISREQPLESNDTLAPVVVSELFRRKGDYLSYMGLYVYLWRQFNE